MADFSSMIDIAAPFLGGPTAGIAGLGGSLLSGQPEGSATASGAQTSGAWNVDFAGKSNIVLIGGALLLIYLLFRGK